MDLQTCKCLLNLANVYLYFDMTEDATKTFQKFIDLYNSQVGQEGKVDWSKEEQFVKLKEFADGCMAQMNGEEEEEGDEYYDEEEESRKTGGQEPPEKE